MFSFPFYLAFVTFPRASLKLSRLTLWITSSGRHTLELTPASCFTIGNKSKGLENIQHQITTQQAGREVYTIVFNREMEEEKKLLKELVKFGVLPTFLRIVFSHSLSTKLRTDYKNIFRFKIWN